MKFKSVLLLTASVLTITANNASASPFVRHHRPQITHQQNASQHRFVEHTHASHRSTRRGYAIAQSAYSSYATPEIGQLVGSDPGREYNLARNWAHWGHAASGPAPGIIGVMAHHVFKVISVIGPAQVLAISGNDSHAVRTRVRSTAGVFAWRSS